MALSVSEFCLFCQFNFIQEPRKICNVFYLYCLQLWSLNLPLMLEAFYIQTLYMSQDKYATTKIIKDKLVVQLHRQWGSHHYLWLSAIFMCTRRRGRHPAIIRAIAVSFNIAQKISNYVLRICFRTSLTLHQMPVPSFNNSCRRQDGAGPLLEFSSK